MAYEKQTWVDGVTTINAERMNHIENGIAEKDDFIVVLTPTALDYSGTMDKTVAEIDAAYKAGRNIVFRIVSSETDRVDIGCTIVQKNDQFEYPSFVIYSVVSTGSGGFLVHAFTGATDNGSKNTYITYVYALTLAH